MPRAAAAKGKEKPKKAAKRKPRAYQLAEAIPPGEMLKALDKKEWKLGRPVGKGGFGQLYLAAPATADPVGADAKYVIKIEPKGNGPLFVEQAFYQRSGKPAMVDDWKRTQKLAHLGVPKLMGIGMHSRDDVELRFLVMERFGEDIWKKYLACGRRFTAKTTFTLAIQVLDSLAYLHSTGYAHADIKSANILLGYSPKEKNQVYLVDFGLASRFCPDGQHREYKEDPKKAHDGTPEFTSRDAHNGVVPSRRGDMEILGYVMIQWLAGFLPWEHKISEAHTDFVYVMNEKKRCMSNIKAFMKECFPAGDPPVELQQYMEIVSKLQYEEVPDYKQLKALLAKAIRASGGKADGKLDFTPPASLDGVSGGMSGEGAVGKSPPGRKRKAPGGGTAAASKRKAAGSARATKRAVPSSSTSDSELDAAKVKRPAGRKASSPAKMATRSSPRKTEVKRGRSKPEVKRDRAKPGQAAKAVRGSKEATTSVLTAKTGEVFTSKKKATGATVTSSTQTSPGLKLMAKVKRKH